MFRLRHLLMMSGLSVSCIRDCSGRGECYNGTCTCDIRFTGELCDGPNLPYHAGIGGVFICIGVVCVIQLILCIISEYVRLKAPSLLKACKITTQKLIYFVMSIASLVRGAYFIFPVSTSLNCWWRGRPERCILWVLKLCIFETIQLGQPRSQP